MVLPWDTDRYEGALYLLGRHRGLDDHRDLFARSDRLLHFFLLTIDGIHFDDIVGIQLSVSVVYTNLK